MGEVFMPIDIVPWFVCTVSQSQYILEISVLLLSFSLKYFAIFCFCVVIKLHNMSVPCVVVYYPITATFRLFSAALASTITADDSTDDDSPAGLGRFCGRILKYDSRDISEL